MGYSRASSQSLFRTRGPWTFPGLTDAGSTCWPSSILLKQSLWRISLLIQSQLIAKSGS